MNRIRVIGLAAVVGCCVLAVTATLQGQDKDDKVIEVVG